MVAITIGLLMMAGILQISAASKESSRLQRNMSFVQENIRIATELLGRDIRQAGYFEDDNPADPITALDPFVDLSDPTTETGDAITADGGGADNDQITVTYESDVDCLGQDTFAAGEEADNHFAVNHYFIENETLKCDGNGGPPKPLVEGVESMQILYGENTDGDPRSANRYVPAGEADPENIVSVRIALRFHSREHIRQIVDNNQYALLDATAVSPAAGDKRLRREITTTIALRNSARN
jgi:type IV pilus assembly protein PilW